MNMIRQLTQVKTDISGGFLAVVNFQIHLPAWLHKLYELKNQESHRHVRGKMAIFSSSAYNDDWIACSSGISTKIYRVCIHVTFFPLAFYWTDKLNQFVLGHGCKINKKGRIHSWKQRGKSPLFRYSFFHQSKPRAQMCLASFLFWALEEREKLILVIKLKIYLVSHIQLNL